MSLFGLFAMLTVVVMVGIRPGVRHPHSFCAGNADLVLRAERCFVGLSQEVLIVHKPKNPEISAIALDDSFIVRFRKFIQSERAAFLNSECLAEPCGPTYHENQHWPYSYNQESPESRFQR